MTMTRTRWLAMAAAATLFLAGCGGGGGAQQAADRPPAAAVGQADIDKAMQTPTELTFWTWVPDIGKEVALFEKKYPAIKVNVVNAGQGEPQYTKLRTALKAAAALPTSCRSSSSTSRPSPSSTACSTCAPTGPRR
ncbi:hypothetical protein ACFQ0B_50830 [Nonomuraea thailandensis]